MLGLSFTQSEQDFIVNIASQRSDLYVVSVAERVHVVHQRLIVESFNWAAVRNTKPTMLTISFSLTRPGQQQQGVLLPSVHTRRWTPELWLIPTSRAFISIPFPLVRMLPEMQTWRRAPFGKVRWPPQRLHESSRGNPPAFSNQGSPSWPWDGSNPHDHNNFHAWFLISV